MKNFILLVLLCTASICLAQNELQSNKISNTQIKGCGTPDLLYKNQEMIDYDNRVQGKQNNGFTQWPIRIHIITKSDGTGGISLDDINKDLANINFVYSQIDLEWFITSVNYIADDYYYDFQRDTLTNLQDITDTYLIDDAINIFFCNSIITSTGITCGFASYPYNGDNSLRMFMNNDCTGDEANGTFAHEFGHHLNLPHTHNGTFSGNNSSNAEHVPRSGANSNCTTHGDYMCDTEADPTGNITNCIYTDNDVDIFGNVYTPPIENIMSYYSDNCGGILTPDQYNRCNNAITTRLGHTAYDIDGAIPNTVSNPSGLTAIMNGIGSIDLVWTDNASNETGYLIERAINGSNYDAFEQAGVAPNITQFSDTDLIGNTTYCYRVKASNDNPDHYSNITCVTTPNIICSSVTNLVFVNTDLVVTPFNITGIPTSIPSCQTSVPITVNLVGDFGSSFEMVDILGEDGTTVLGTTTVAGGDCDAAGVTTNFNLTAAQYNTWAANGAITLAVSANANVDDICSSNNVEGCADIAICTSTCPTNLTLTSPISTTVDYEVSNVITADNLIQQGADATYDAANYIQLNNGFEVQSGAIFHAFIDGCGGQ